MDERGAFPGLPAGTTITVRALKYDGAEYRRWSGTLRGRVAGGIVIEAVFSAVVEGRTPFFGGDRAVEWFWSDRGYNVIAGYAPDGALRALYCNICAPAEFVVGDDGPELRFLDLDLDVLVRPDGACVVTDEDEFARNAERYGYPLPVREGARASVAALLDAVRARRPPFDAIGLGAAGDGEQGVVPR